MTFDEIFDLTAGSRAYFYIYNTTAAAGLRRGGLTPACGFAHTRSTGSKRSGEGMGTVEMTHYRQEERCGMKPVHSIASMRWSGCVGGLHILRGESNGTVGRTRNPL